MCRSRSRRTSAADSVAVRVFLRFGQLDLGEAARLAAVLTDRGLDHWGRYVDEFIRVDGEWRIAHRRVSVDGRRPDSPFSEPSVEGESRR